MAFDSEKESVDKDDIAAAKVLREYEALVYQQDENEAKNFNLVRDGDSDGGSGLWDAETRAAVDAYTLKTLFFSEDWVFIIVDLIAMKISNQYLRVMQEITEDGKTRVKPAEHHPLQTVIDNPNKYQDYHAFMYSLVVDTVLIGNGLVWSGVSGEMMIVIPAEQITADFDGSGDITKYMVTQITSQTEMVANRVASFPAEQVAHVRRPNPSSALWGLSPFIPGKKSMLFNRYSSEYLNNFYLKGATPGLALEMEDSANEQNALRLLRSFEMAYTGRRNQRRTLVLPKGVKAKEITHSLADQQLSTYLDKNRQTILALLKVPPHEVGLQSGASLGSEEYKTALRNFWSSTLKPTMRMISGALTKHFKNKLGEGFFLDFVVDDIDILQENADEKASLAEKLLKTHTLNEVRSKLYELGPVPGGDTVMGMSPPNPFSPFGLSAQPAQVAQPATVETKEVDKEPASARVRKSGDAGWFERREELAEESLKEGVDTFVPFVLEALADMTESMIRGVKKALSEKAAERKISKAELRKLLTTLAKKKNFESKWVSSQVDAFESTVETGYDVALSVPFKLPNTEQLETLRARNAKGRREILEERALFTFAKVSETTTEKIMAIVERGIGEQKTVDQIVRDIVEEPTFSNIKDVNIRAETIARTETLVASSIGQAAMMQDAAEVIPDLQKMWLSARDNRVRGKSDGLYPDSKADHDGLDGMIVAHDKAFKDPRNGDKLMYPRDTSGRPESTINCRCTMIVLPADQMKEIAE